MKLKLSDCIDKVARITTIDGQVFEGETCDYIPPQDNVPEIASISIGDIEIYESEVTHIEILE
ncbi:MAG: hypothetical protein ACI4SX_08030 [Candidatus Fimenecus sp.]